MAREYARSSRWSGRSSMNSTFQVIDRRLRAPTATLDAMPTTSPISPVLVTGATGKTGTRVTRGLEARGVTVRAASRSGAVPFDWDDRSTWAPALEGAAARSRSPTRPTSPCPARPRPSRRSRAAAVDGRRAPHRAALRPRRGGGRSAPSASSGRPRPQADRRPLRVLHAELQRERVRSSRILDGRARAAGGRRAPSRSSTRTTSPPRWWPRSPRTATQGRTYEVTGPRMLTFAEAVAEIARGARAATSATSTVPAADYARGARRRRPAGRRRRSCSCTSSPRSSTAATRRSPTASRRPSGARRATSPPTRRRRRGRAPGAQRAAAR